MIATSLVNVVSMAILMGLLSNKIGGMLFELENRNAFLFDMIIVFPIKELAPS